MTRLNTSTEKLKLVPVSRNLCRYLSWKRAWGAEDLSLRREIRPTSL